MPYVFNVIIFLFLYYKRDTHHYQIILVSTLGSATPRPHTAPPRVKPEAESTASIGRGKRMKIIVNEYAKSGPTPRNPRVKPEAVETAEVHKVGFVKMLTQIQTRGLNVLSYIILLHLIKASSIILLTNSTARDSLNMKRQTQTSLQ